MPRGVGVEMPHEQGGGIQMRGRTAERVVERGTIVHLQSDHLIDADCFEQLGGVAGGYRVPCRGTTLLAGIGEVGYAGADAFRTGVFERSDEEQQAAQPVVGRSLGIAEQVSEPRKPIARRTLSRARNLRSSPVKVVSSCRPNGRPSSAAMRAPKPAVAAGANTETDSRGSAGIDGVHADNTGVICKLGDPLMRLGGIAVIT